MNEFLQRLKQRKLVQWAVAYVAAAFALLQGVDIIAQRFLWPDAVERGLIIASCVGFFVVLVLAWYHGDRGAQRVTTIELLLLALLLSLGGGFLWRYTSTARTPAPSGAAAPAPMTAIPEKSIAVLPFENLSSDKENAYFADGIQDEILTRLAKIAALKVISRTSTQKYKSAPDNLREVGKQLGVANLLEGSVQKVANSVHVNVQLIRATTDEHLWAESYNRKLDDVFGVEGEVAGVIAEQLKAKLTNQEKQELAAKPTDNAAAYDAFLRGLALAERPDIIGSDQREAARSFETAVKLDPNFALAWAWLSRTHAGLFFNTESSPAQRDAAQSALQNAVRLQPDLIETQLAQAYYHYFVERDYDDARKIFAQVQARSPNDSAAPLALALISRRQGQWDESLSYFNEAAELDPRNLKVLIWTSDTYAAMRQFPPALKFINRALDIAPSDNGALSRKAEIYFRLGQIKEAKAAVEQMHPDSADSVPTATLARQLLFERNYSAGIALLQSVLVKLDASNVVERMAYSYGLGEFQRLSGDPTSAKDNYTQSRDVLETVLHQQPDSAALVSALSAVYTGLGEKDSALKQAELAIADLPTTKDAVDGPTYEENLARVLARFGEKDKALKILQHLLITPYFNSITPASLRIDPDWDNLRGDPRFEKLCQEKQS